MINKKSLKNIISNFDKIKPVKLYGFKREFNVYENRKFTIKNEGNISVLNISKSYKK